MTYTWAPWTGAVRCTSGATPGARALLAWVLETFPSSRSLGIYNCRNVRGSRTTSLHGEGRALDAGFPVIGGRAHDEGRELVDRLGPYGHRLGIQAVIFDRTIYSAKSPDGRPYTGVAPHVDHAHVELTWAAAERLTLATCRAVLGGPSTPQGETMLKRGDYGPGVRVMQEALVAEAKLSGRGGPAGEGMPDSTKPDGSLDGIFGDEVDAAVRTYQAGARIPVTGNLDGLTVAFLARYAPVPR